MLILALDSTALVASVALCRDDVPVVALSVNNGNTHSETVLPMVEQALRLAKISIHDIDLFACNVGPGSFTGVRIGVATLKGLAFGRNKPCIGVSTCESLAENAVPFQGLICPVMNARRGQLYNALFSCTNGMLTRLCADRAIGAADLEAELLKKNKPFCLVGDGVKEAIRLFTGISPVSVSSLLTDQNAVSVAKCAKRAYLAGQNVTDAQLAPVYLRLPQAERERLEKLEKGEKK